MSETQLVLLAGCVLGVFIVVLALALRAERRKNKALVAYAVRLTVENAQAEQSLLRLAELQDDLDRRVDEVVKHLAIEAPGLLATQNPPKTLIN